MSEPGAPVVGGWVVALCVLGGLGMARAMFALGERRGVAAAGRARLAPVGATAGSVVRPDRWVTALRTSVPVQRWSARRADAERVALLPEFVDAVSRALAGGASVLVALSDAGDAIGPPFAEDMARVSGWCDAGLSLTDALDRWADDVGGEGAQLFVTACRLGVESGRGTSGALSGVAETLADRRDVAAESDALAAQAKASAAMLTGLPVVVSLGMAFVDPSSIRTLLATPLGLGCLAVGGGLDAVGALWMRRMIRAVT